MNRNGAIWLLGLQESQFSILYLLVLLIWVEDRKMVPKWPVFELLQIVLILSLTRKTIEVR